MLDIATYRHQQALAQQNLDHWLFRGMQSPAHFTGVGFPTQVESLAELRVLLGLMHEGRFDTFMAELGGLTAPEFDILCERLVRHARFAARTFQAKTVRLPLSSMIAHMVLMKRLTGFDPAFSTIVEIGPGDGHTGYFLEGHAPLKEYWQVEVTETYYLLQHALGMELFGDGFVEHAFGHYAAARPGPLSGNASGWDRPEVKVPRPEKVHHIPWWRLGDVPQDHFDIVTSNANLNEFSEGAFHQYVGLFHRWLKPSGALIVHCIGGGKLSINTVLTGLLNSGFALVVADIAPMRFGQPGSQVHALENLVLVKEGHPLYNPFAGNELSLPRLDTSIEFVRRMFVRDEPGRRAYSVAEVESEVSKRLMAECR